MLQRTQRSNTLLIIGSPADKYIWVAFLALIGSLINVIPRNEDNTKASFIEQQYEKFYNFFNGSHFMIYAIGHLIVVFVSYWTIGTIYTVIDVMKGPEFLTRYKIQPEKNSSSTNPSILRCIRQVFFNQCLVIPFAIGNFFMASRFGDVNYRPDQLPTFFTLILDMIVNSTVLEIGFYYGHRILHHPLMYKHIHKMHHEYISPIAISFFYTHPLEHTFGVLVPFVLGQYVRPTHILSAFLWVSIAIITGMLEHSGYHFPLFASTEFHDYHHLRFNQNYGLVGLMDWIHGTNKEFIKSKAGKRNFCFYDSRPLKTIIPDESKESKQVVDNNANNTL